MKEFGEFLKAWRRDTGSTQEEAAERLGISRTYVSEIERGVATNLSFELGARILELASWLRATEMPVTVIPTFALVRYEDETGVSGTGTVAYGAVFPNGRTVVAWCVERKPQSVAVYDSIHDMFAVHVGPHGGKTEIDWLTLPPAVAGWMSLGQRE